MYDIGAKVVHPMHGAATVESIKDIEIAGKKHKYYELKFVIGNMTTNVPVDNVDKIGIRNVIDKAEAQKALEYFISAEIIEDHNWNQRQRDNMDKIKSGDIFQVMDVLKNLMYRDKIKGLSTSERKILGNAKQIVISELISAGVAEQKDIESILEDSVGAMLSVAG
ncbi:MAG: CarD family transcriptional regulator [Firmicutes bacterium]|nr:CarD family transcriptional regulator [Bacillota bacterium]